MILYSDNSSLSVESSSAYTLSEVGEADPALSSSSFDFGSGMITNILLLVAIFFLIMLFTRSRR